MFSGTTQDFTEQLGARWCGLMHDSPMWPIHGQYQCRTCGRHYPVQWAGSGTSLMRQTPSPSVKFGALPLVVILAVLVHANVHAADAPIVTSNDGAAMAFARYVAGQTQAAPWNVETIEIDASLPKMKTQGRLRAIRRLLLGKPEYQVLELEGDKTVRQQVILRYLSAQMQAALIPASSVAITPANYSFSYKGPVEIAGAAAYSFAIKPRKKREGLIKGELWLDGETGAVVRQSGYLVKNPSIFVKRVTLTRETGIHDGLAEQRITHLSVDTRLVGRAELTVHERPYIDLDPGSAPGIEER
jgi:hypothetical protein